MTVALAPLKRLRDAKSRLRPVMNADERVRLSKALLRHSVDELREAPAVTRIVLVSSEVQLAADLGIEQSPDCGGLNLSLVHALQSLSGEAESALIIPADLPFITAESITGLISTAAGSRGVSIVPTQDGGTGALLLFPPNVMEPAFGQRSFARHAELAERAGAPVHCPAIPELAFDLDTATDLKEALERGWTY